MNPTVMPAGSMQPPTDLPGTGTVWLLGYFGSDLQYRWVAVDAGTEVKPPEPQPPQPPQQPPTPTHPIQPTVPQPRR